MKKIPLSLFLVIVFVTNAFSQNGNEPVLVTDLLKIKTSSNITLTKDGMRAAYTVTSIEPDENSKLDYKYLTQIYYFSTGANTNPVQLTTAKEGAAQPAWSPDGQKLAFVRNVSGKPQVFILSLQDGEPVQLTKSKYGASNPKWSPDGKKLLYSSSMSLDELVKDTVINSARSVPRWPGEKPGFDRNEQMRINNAKPDPNGNLQSIHAYLEKNVADKKAIVLNKLNFQSENNISAEMNFNQFYIIDTSGGEPVLLTELFNRYNAAEFLPDGKGIIVSGDIDSLEMPDRSQESQVYLMDVDGKNKKLILGSPGKTYTNATVSSTGKWLAFLHDTTTYSWVPKLAIMPLNGTMKEMIHIPFDRNINNMTWSVDDKYIYFTAPTNGGTPLYRLTVATKKIETLSTSDAGITSYDIVGNKIVFTRTQPTNPSEVFIADAMLKGEKQVSDHNAWVKPRKLSMPVKGTFVNEKGLTVEYWVMKPSNFKEGEKYPLLLEIHGGPTAMWGPGEASMWHEFQYFCSQGYGVVYSNPRGSGGYGAAFVKANINDWGAGPASDVLTAVDKAVAQGWADPKRLLITGGSYAGYLTAWIISHDKRFAAACSQRGVYDLPTFFGEGNAWRLVPRYFGGYPWEPEVRTVLNRESPINYVHNITTPYIIFHGANDRRTGFVQSEMMYRSLKVLNRPVEYVVHPGATHEITRSGDNRQRIDQMLRTYEFFQRWVGKNSKPDKPSAQ